MSATVDFRTRTSSEMNPRKGQNSSPFLFDFVSFSQNQCPKNLNSPSFSIPETAKPSPVAAPVEEDLNKGYPVKPRLVKHRRHSVNVRGKSRVLNSSESKLDSSFISFQSKQPDFSSSDGAAKNSEGSGDQFRGGKPFDSNSKSTGVSFSFYSIKEEDFVFGINRENLISNLNSSSGSGGTTPTLFEERKESKITSRAGDNEGRNSQNSNNAGFRFKFGEIGSQKSNLTSNSNSGLGGITGTVLPDEMRKTITSETVDNSGGSSIGKEGFVFGTRRESGFGENPNFNGVSVLLSEGRNLKVTNGVEDKLGSNCTSQNAKDAAFTFKFFGRGKLDLNSDCGFGEIPSGKGENGCSNSISQNSKDATFSSKFGGIGNSNSNPNSGFGGIAGTFFTNEMQKGKISSVIGDNRGNGCTLQNTGDPALSFKFGERGNSMPNFSGGSGGIAESTTPDEMRQLRIGSGMGDNMGNDYDSQNAKDAGLTFKFGERGSWVSGDASERNVFVFGDNGKRNPTSKENSDSGFCGHNASVLPDELRKLKIGSICEDSSDNFSSPGKPSISQVNSSHSDAGNGSSFLKVLGEKAFFFGSNMEKSSDRKDPTSFSGAESRLPDKTRSLNIRSRARCSRGRKQKATSGSHICSARFRSRNCHNAEGAESSLSSTGKMEKGLSSSRSTSEEMDADNFEVRVTHNLAGDVTIPSKFTFQAGNFVDGFTVDSDPYVEPINDSKPSVFVGSSSSASSLSSSSSVGQGFQSFGDVFAEFPPEKVEKKAGFCFGSTGDVSGHMVPEIPKQDLPSLQKEPILLTPIVEPFTVLHQNIEFSAKGGALKSAMRKKRREKMRQYISVNQRGGQHSVLKEKKLPESSELGSPGSCSPMDISPYQEALPANECLRGTSVSSNGSVNLSANHPSIYPQQSVRDEYCEPETGNTGSKDETKTEFDFSVPTIEKPEIDSGEKISFSLKPENVNKTNLTFAASLYTQGLSSRGRHRYKKTHRLKVGQDAGSSTPTTKPHSASPFVQFFPLAGSSLQPGPVQVEPGSQADNKNNNFAVKGPEVGKEFMASSIPNLCSVPPAQTISSTMASIPTASVTAAALEACEKWRLRGNEAYSTGDLSRAEGYYTSGVNSIPSSVTSINCVKAIMLCYSNRAATRMSLGRMREALVDCMKAAAVDPGFLKVQLRAANCHLALGEIEDALKQFKKCIQSENQSSDKKIISEASDGLRQAQLVAEYMDQSAELLRRRTSDDANSALQIISEALLTSPYSEQLIEMKAETLLMLHKYEEVIQLCEQTQDSAERNLPSISHYILLGNDSASKMSSATIWRCHLISKAYFRLGKLEEALELLQKHEQMDHLVEKNGSGIKESLGAFVVTMRDLLRHKTAGNDAFQAGRNLEAVEHYTTALSCNMESRPFSAICFCNRAAAYQALGQITDAIGDCSLAMALDSNYSKAISRRTTLHEMIRDYGQAQNDLQRLVSLLEKQIENKASQSGILSKSGSYANDLKQARLRLTVAEEDARKEMPLDMYLILGIEPSCNASDIKKAYRKAALRHHPDKAGQFLARSENGDDRLWKEIAIEFHKDADRLFKMIGEAYAILSDPIKRSQYDMEEDIRKIQKKGTGGCTSQASADTRSYPFDRSSGSSWRQWQDTSRSYGGQYHRRSATNRYS